MTLEPRAENLIKWKPEMSGRWVGSLCKEVSSPKEIKLQLNVIRSVGSLDL